MHRKKQNIGFTLSEMLVVIIVVAVLSAIAVPMYNKVISRSRASDALKVLSVASSKQEAYFIDNGQYANTFGELSAPVKGLSGDASVTIGKFDYAMSGGCMVAIPSGDNPKYAIYKNFQTQQDGCLGEGCTVLMDLIPIMGSVGCDLSAFGKSDGNTIDDDFCTKNPDLCGTSDPSSSSCPTGKIKNQATGACVCANVCSGGAVQDVNTCACSCPSSCAIEGQLMISANCYCSCPSSTPYIYNGKCNACKEDSVITSTGECCPEGSCYDSLQGICHPEYEGSQTQTQTCGGGNGTQSRSRIAGCPGSWDEWDECECQAGTTMENGICVVPLECTAGDTQSCGTCGMQTCTAEGQWGTCVETTPPTFVNDGQICGKCGEIIKSLVCKEDTATWTVVGTCENEKEAGTCYSYETQTCFGGNGVQTCNSDCSGFGDCVCNSGYTWDGIACKADPIGYYSTRAVTWAQALTSFDVPRGAGSCTSYQSECNAMVSDILADRKCASTPELGSACTSGSCYLNGSGTIQAYKVDYIYHTEPYENVTCVCNVTFQEAYCQM